MACRLQSICTGKETIPVNQCLSLLSSYTYSACHSCPQNTFSLSLLSSIVCLTQPELILCTAVAVSQLALTARLSYSALTTATARERGVQECARVVTCVDHSCRDVQADVWPEHERHPQGCSMSWQHVSTLAPTNNRRVSPNSAADLSSKQ